MQPSPVAGIRVWGAGGGVLTALQMEQTAEVVQTTQLGSAVRHAAAAAFPCAHVVAGP